MKSLNLYKVISVGEAADILGLDRTTVRKAIRRKLIENVDYRISKGTMLVEVRSLTKMYPKLNIKEPPVS